MDERILITSAGGLVGTFLLKHLRSVLPQSRLIAIDINEHVPCKKWCNTFYKVPVTSDPGYGERIKEIVFQEGVDYILLGSSYDVQFFSQLNDTELQGRYLCVDKETLELLHNKQTLYQWAKVNGLRTPQLYTNIESIRFPALAKPISSTGSKGVFLLEDMEAVKRVEHIVFKPNYIVMEYLIGEEFTIDCLFNTSGKLIGHFPRKRIKTVGGGAVICTSQPDLDVSLFLDRFSQLGQIKGVANFQIIVSPDGQQTLIDFNPRFASGGLPLTVACGFDLPIKLIELLRNGETAEFIKANIMPTTMIRYYEEYFIEEFVSGS